MAPLLLNGTLLNGSLPQPLIVATPPQGLLGVNVEPDGYTKAELAVSFLNLFATVAVAVVLAFVGDSRQEKRSRLQQHTAALASSDGLSIIREFRQQCKELSEGNGYGGLGGVWRLRKPISANGVNITRDDFHRIDRARRDLLATWDTIINDFKFDRLPHPITHKENSIMLRRDGANYRSVVEPLEAANYKAMQEGWMNAPAAQPYMVWPALEDNPQLLEAGLPAADLLPLFNTNVCPSRFRWLEEQNTLKILKSQSFWARHTLKATDTLWNAPTVRTVRVQLPEAQQQLREPADEFIEASIPALTVNPTTWAELGKSHAGTLWKEQLLNHWCNVWETYIGPRAQEVAPAHRPIVDDRELLAKLVELLGAAAAAQQAPQQPPPPPPPPPEPEPQPQPQP